MQEDGRWRTACGTCFASGSKRAKCRTDCRKCIAHRQIAERMRKMRGNVTGWGETDLS